ncbi:MULTISPECIES: metallophosphoesterase family protein [Mycobacterium avium complex (MAC)]|uniref:metallophosphoesterase family protein n=1 Tax=Mycobacterium avium complex (MAC) TaxID=120793 RepID=UPI001FCA33A6|nr:MULTISPECIES: metallophosphoesterase [Mycobacterium avium complex (MAC)]
MNSNTSPAAKPVGALRVLLIADTDPQLPAGLTGYVQARHVDIVITVGDLHAGLLKGISEQPLAMGVYGNHCNGTYLDELGMINLHRRRTQVAGISFVGLEGCVRYKDDPYDILYTQDEYRDIVADLPGADVLVTHCPPLGVNDHRDPAHVGIAALRDWVHRHRPSLIVHGHTYPRPPQTRFGTAQVAYVHGARVLDLIRRAPEGGP